MNPEHLLYQLKVNFRFLCIAVSKAVGSNATNFQFIVTFFIICVRRPSWTKVSRLSEVYTTDQLSYDYKIYIVYNISV